MRATQILAALDGVPPEIAQAIYDLDARAYRSNAPVRLSEAEAFIRLLDACKAAGSDTAFARRCGITRQSLSDIMNSKRPMSQRVLKAIGLRELKSRVYAPTEI